MHDLRRSELSRVNSYFVHEAVEDIVNVIVAADPDISCSCVNHTCFGQRSNQIPVNVEAQYRSIVGSNHVMPLFIVDLRTRTEKCPLASYDDDDTRLSKCCGQRVDIEHWRRA